MRCKKDMDACGWLSQCVSFQQRSGALEPANERMPATRAEGIRGGESITYAAPVPYSRRFPWQSNLRQGNTRSTVPYILSM